MGDVSDFQTWCDMKAVRPRRFVLDAEQRRQRLEALWDLAQPCRICGRACMARRLDGQVGVCGVAHQVAVSWVGPHHGEEPPISGRRGSGTVFFLGCGLGCPYCQNYQISDSTAAEASAHESVEELAEQYLSLQERGCHNLNWVTPSHVVPMAVEALFLADERGFRLPVVYNSSAYDGLETLRLLDGIVDIYLPDFKYGPKARLAELRAPSNLVDVSRAALAEMYRQVGGLVLDESGVAVSGVLVRHLVLPGDMADSRGVLELLAGVMDEDLSLSLMSQYRPPRPGLRPPLDRGLAREEYESVLEAVEDISLRYGWMQELEAASIYFPDFSQANPFQSP